MAYPNLHYRVPTRYPDLSYAHMIALPTGEPCELVRPQYFGFINWFGIPLPDYSFALEPETKERKIDEILEKLKNGVASIQQSSVFRDFLLTMAKFHDYSIGNTILIMLQKRDATQVAGFNTWKDLGRFVKAGEHGIAILAPCFSTQGEAHWISGGSEWAIRRKGDEFEVYLLRAGGAQIIPQRVEHTASSRAGAEGYLRSQGAMRSEDRAISPTYFKVVYVFDVAQTTGKELPHVEVPTLTGEANEDLFNRILLLDKNQGVDVSFEPRPHQEAEVKGLYIGKSIWVKGDEARAQQLKTLIHENGHYYTETVFQIPRSDAETIAESVAFVVGAHFGFDTGTRSFPYVAIWSQNKDVLEKNLSSIRSVASRMIDGIEGVVSTPSQLWETLSRST